MKFVKEKNRKSFFFKVINSKNALVSKAFKLAPKEVKVLTILHCMHNSGRDINNTDLLTKRLVEEERLLKNRGDVATYRNRFKTKGWAKIINNVYTLVDQAAYRDGELRYSFNICHYLKPDEIAKRKKNE